MNTNHVTFSENGRPWSHSFGQVSLPKKAEISSARHSVVASLVATSAVASRALKTSSSLAHLWREIQGSNNWEDLVDPLHPLLRQEIVRYGEFVAACYKAFDLNPNSKRYLNCKYGKKNMFREVGMESCGYHVTKYVYATPDINIPIPSGDSCGRWIGYVAVSGDDSVRRLGRRDILIAFRGTVTNPEWITNLMSSLTPARLDPNNLRPDVKVEAGFLSLYTSDESSCKFGLGSCREQLLSEVSRLLKKYKGEKISISLAGHSMGSSLALLLAYDIAELGLNDECQNSSRHKTPITVFSFGGPRVGNDKFKQRCEELGVKVLRVVNVNDPITKMPGVLFNENFRFLGGRYELPWSCSCYAHVGVELAINFYDMQNPSCVHDLETYISLLKSPKRKQMQMDSSDLLNRARQLLIMSAQNLNIFPWRTHAERNTSSTMNLVQS